MGNRVAVIEYANESNTFTINHTGLHDFRTSRYIAGADIIDAMRGTGSEIGGCIDVAAAENWVLVPIVSAHAQPGGPVTEEARQEITSEITRRLEAEGPFDGIFIALHGAMVTETAQDGESQFLSDVRASVGGDVPIAVTLDLHANIFDPMADLIQIAVSYRTYPHVDMRDRATEACGLLHRAMAGEISPQVMIARPPMLVGCDDGRTTDDGPMCRILEHAAQEMRAPGILNVAVNAGFTDADVFAAGPSVLVTYEPTQVTPSGAAHVAHRICDVIWGLRHEYLKPIDLQTCVAQLLAAIPGAKPIVVADYSDNPGSGAYGDCTAVLAALLDAGFNNCALGALYDPQAARALAEAGIGRDVTLLIGGKSDSQVGGGPLQVSGTVMAVSDGDFTYEGPMFTGLRGAPGASVCFRIKGIDVMIVSENYQMLDQNIFRAVGIEPTEKSIVVVKSMQHFRGAFGPIAAKVLVTDAGGLCTPDVTRRAYRHLRRPAFPLDGFDG